LLLPSLPRAVCVYVYVYTGRLKRMSGSGKRCQTVGLEDTRHPGKLRKYQCCPVSSSSSSSQRSSSNGKKNKAKLASAAGLGIDEEYIDEDDLIDDDDDSPDDANDSNSRKKPYDPHDDPSPSPQLSISSSPPPSNQHGDQNYQHRSSSPSHIQSYVYISDDDFISDAGIEHIASDAFLHHQSHLLISSTI